MYATVRRYTLASALGDAMAAKSADVERVLRGVPGFAAYYAIRQGDTIATVTVCDDKTGTEESSRRAAEWVRENLAQGAIGAPEIFAGEIFIGFDKSRPGVQHRGA